MFPIENLETIEIIKKNQNNLETINLNNIFDKDIEKDNLFVIIDFNEQKTKFFFKRNYFVKKNNTEPYFDKQDE